jgi:hypothetical protein
VKIPKFPAAEKQGKLMSRPLSHDLEEKEILEERQ